MKSNLRPSRVGTVHDCLCQGWCGQTSPLDLPWRVDASALTLCGDSYTLSERAMNGRPTMEMRAFLLLGALGAVSSCGASSETAVHDTAGDVVAASQDGGDLLPPGSLAAEIPSPPKTTTTSSATPTSVLGRTATFVVDSNLSIVLSVPESFGPTRTTSVITERDRVNGLYVLERWIVNDSLLNATFSVQMFPGDGSQLVQNLSKPFASANGLEWSVLEGGEASPHKELIIAFARHGDYLLGISGEQRVIDQLVVGMSTQESAG